MFAAAFTVVQLAWDTWTTYRGIGGWEITKLIKSNANLIPTKATLINVSFHAPLPPPHPHTHTHQHLGASTSLLEEFPKYSDH